MAFERHRDTASDARRHYLRDDTIFRQGDFATGWFDVVDGMARISQFRSDGRRQVLAFAVPGDVVGLEQGQRDCCAEALTSMQMIYHPFARRSGDDRTELPWNRVVRANHESMALIGLPSAAGRVAAFLLTMMRRLNCGTGFDLPMPRVDIADHLGLTMHTVSRTICDLARRGLIAVAGHHHFMIIEFEGLATLAGVDLAEFFSGDQQLVA